MKKISIGIFLLLSGSGKKHKRKSISHRLNTIVINIVGILEMALSRKKSVIGRHNLVEVMSFYN